MRPCDVEALEAQARGELDGERRGELEKHVEECASCKAELDWLVRERAVFGWRAALEPRVPSTMWQAVEARIEEHRAKRAPRRARLLAGAASVAAAAAMAVFVGHGVVAWMHEHRLEMIGDRDARRALAGAESEYTQAIAVLEDEYAEAARRHGGAPARETQGLARLRQSLDAARRSAGDDIDERARVLDGYADYVGALQTAVHDLEVKR